MQNVSAENIISLVTGREILFPEKPVHSWKSLLKKCNATRMLEQGEGEKKKISFFGFSASSEIEEEIG